MPQQNLDSQPVLQSPPTANKLEILCANWKCLPAIEKYLVMTELHGGWGCV